MGTLYLDRKHLSLELRNGQLLIREPQRPPRGIPLKLLERLVIRAHTGLDSSLLAALGQAGIGVLCLGGRHGRQRALLHGPGHADARRRLAQYRVMSEPAIRSAWTRLLLRAKLAAQRQLLAEALSLRPDRRKPLHDAVAQHEALLPRLAQTDDLDALRGLEGAAAAVYFAALATLFPPSLGFHGRHRRPPPDPVNAALSLGYTLLHGEAVLACHGAGLDPLLGFFHEPAYGRESLACDLIEPLRPRLDGWVWRLFAERELRAEHFTRERSACLLGKSGRELYFPRYERLAVMLRRYLRRACYRLAAALKPLAPALAESAEELP
ncbi:MAG TPA: CRISPR-associated endonuclease Cas1 [Candidatus Competibacteraceae bacterium]|nr:CRISPR-associated endonuclease Cas1 [Candidatus Competibacteraceae bacterium]